MTTNPSTPTDTVLFIHGLWMTPRSWERWIERYTGRGHRVVAPAWPGMEGEVEELRRDPSPIARVTAADVVDHYERVIRELERPPIVMGHSFGGAFVQVLLDRGLGAAGVGIHSAPAKGIWKLPLSTIRSAWPVLRNPANRHRAVPMTPKHFRYAFGNKLSAEESQRVYERYHVPAAGNVLFEGSLANVKRRSPFRVDYRKEDRAPLLFIAGGADHVIPSSVNEASFERYEKSRAITAYEHFPGRSHYTLGQDGWEEVADYALEWATKHAAGRPA